MKFDARCNLLLANRRPVWSWNSLFDPPPLASGITRCSFEEVFGGKRGRTLIGHYPVESRRAVLYGCTLQVGAAVFYWCQLRWLVMRVTTGGIMIAASNRSSV